MIVPVTRFKRPNGEQIDDSTTIADDCDSHYRDVRNAGCRLTAEVLQTGHVSCCIEHPDFGDFAISVTANGPEVQRGIEKMLREFTPDNFAAWREQLEL